MSEMLREAIAQLDDRLQARDGELRQAQAQYREEQEKIRSEISSLEQRLDALVQQQRLIEEQRASVAEEHVSELMAALTAGLKQSASSIVGAANFLLKRLRLAENQAKLLESEPELARQYADFLAVEATRDTLPRSYLRFHEAIERRLSPFLRLKDQESGLHYNSPILLMIALALDEEEGMAHWILPFPDESRLPGQGRNLLSDQIMETMTNAVAAVAEGADWHLANIMPDLWWSGYPALAASCRYDGVENADESAEGILSEYFFTKSLFRNCDLQVNVIEIGMEMWQRGIPGGKAAAGAHAEETAAVATEVGGSQYLNEEGQSVGTNDRQE